VTVTMLRTTIKEAHNSKKQSNDGKLMILGEIAKRRIPDRI